MQRVKKAWNLQQVLSLFDPVIGDWFSSKYSKLTEPQSYAIPLIHKGKNILVSSPTGSGKTLTAFISIINELFLLAKKGQLEDKVYCVYISPLKALANDIHRNLEVPLQEIRELAKKKGMEIPNIRVAVRSGDTSQQDRQKMLRKPPHIFITTPESLSLALTAPKFREKFKEVKYVIVDEIHELAGNKRGVMLSLNLERLWALAGGFQRIGLSATQAPIEEIAKYLAGYENGELREIYIVEVEARKKLDLRVITPVEDLTMVPYEVANEKMYDILVDIINKHRTTLIFTNTRSGTEHVAYKLKERGVEKLEAHHGSLSKETRLRVEGALKNGELKCVISSTSLELGIDIGYIDIVVQIGSPKSVAKGLQRIGRSGHAYGSVSKGRFVVFDNDDLIECTTLIKCAYEGKIDRIRIPKNSLDVLAQIIVGMSLEKRWNVREAYEIVRQSYCYHDLPFEKFLEVLRYLGGKVLGDTVYSKIWFDEDEMIFGKKRSARMIYFMNMGTIPDEADYLVVDKEGKRLGDLSEKFVERLRKGDVFVLGARSYEVLTIKTGKVIVRDATGKRPTVPSWVGEMLPRSFDLSVEVGKFRKFVEDSIKKYGKEKTLKILMKDYYLDYKGAKSIVSYISQGMHAVVPTHERVVIEGYIDPSGKHSIIFHFPFGRRVNDALSRAYAYKLTEKYGVNVGISINDDAFMLTTKKRIKLQEVRDLLTPDELEDILRRAIFNTEMFKQRFRHCASRSFMVLRRYKGRDISVARQQLRSDRILKLLSEIPEFPVMEETYNEILNIVMDLPNAKEVLRKIENGETEVKLLGYTDAPSVFAHNIILAGISDIVLMEDRSALLKELHMKLLERVIPKEELATVFEESEVIAYFHNKVKIRNKEDIMNFLRNAPGADILHRRGINIFEYSELPLEKLQNYVEELVMRGKIVSVYTTRLLWTTEDNFPIFSTLYAKECEELIEFEGEKKVEDIAKETGKKVAEVREILRCMEKAYLVGRKILNNEVYWYRREKIEMERDYAIEMLIRNLLYFRAPLTFEEIVYSLHIDEEDIRRVLKYMVESGEVVKGIFLVGYGEQYMLRKDYEELQKRRGVDEEELQSYRFGKIVRKMSLEEYFQNFLVAFDEDSLRVRGCWDEFMNEKKRGNVFYGRFMRGRLCYAHKNAAPLLIKMYRREEMGEKEKKVYSLIGLLGKDATPVRIKSISNLYPHEVKRILEKLENNLYIYREKGPNGYFYRLMKIEPQGSEEEFFHRIVKGYGPITRQSIEYLTSLDPKDYLGKFKKISSGGRIFYYEDKKIGGNGKGDYILPYTDPFVYPQLNHIYDSLGEVHSHVYVKDGKILATGEIKRHPDYIEVKECIGDKSSFYRLLKNEGIVLSHERVSGYRKIGDFYVYGDVHPSTISLSKIILYLLWKNRIMSGRKLKSTLDVAKFLLGVHDELELIRAYKPLEIDKYYRSELLYETVDFHGHTIYATPDSIALFQALKNMEMDKEMMIVAEIIRKYRKIGLRELYEESPLGIEKTQRAIKELYEGNYIAQYPGGYRYIEKKYSRDYAVQKFVEHAISIFGFLNPQIISHFTNNLITPEESAYYLSQHTLVKGFFLNDGRMYRIPEKDLEDLEFLESDEAVVLDPKDPLALILSYLTSRHHRGYLVLQGGKIIGWVSARKMKNKLKILKYTSDEAVDVFKKFFR